MTNNKQQTEMNKEFAPYELALELKELGFDEPCLAYWDNNKLFVIDRNSGRIQKNSNYKDIFEGIISAPTYSQAFRWFRKKGYRFSVIIDSPLAEEESHYIEIWFEKQFLHESHYIYKKYEDAELDLLKKLIQYEKEKQQ